ncbi:MAG: ArsR/SmtB family transcription factor [Candidatus Saliniplasma sp.]
MTEELIPTINQIKVLSNASRLQVMALLLEKERTISELAKKLDLTPQTVHHHVHKLLDSGLIHVSREETHGNLVSRYYAVEEEWLDSYDVWDDLELEEKKNYKLAALGTVKGMVNKGIRYIQNCKRIDYEVGWVATETIPFSKEAIDELREIFKETREKLREIEKKDEDDEEELTVLMTTLPG